MEKKQSSKDAAVLVTVHLVQPNMSGRLACSNTNLCLDKHCLFCKLIR